VVGAGAPNQNPPAPTPPANGPTPTTGGDGAVGQNQQSATSTGSDLPVSNSERKSETPPISGFYTTVQFEGLRLYLQVSEIAKKGKWFTAVPVSKEVAKLLALNPIGVYWSDGGKVWQVQLPLELEARTLLSSEADLTPIDLESVRKILAIPYINKWMVCARQLVARTPTADCIRDLIESVCNQETDDECRVLLLSQLMDQLNCAANFNHDKEASLLVKSEDTFIQQAQRAHRSVETAKAFVAISAATGPNSDWFSSNVGSTQVLHCNAALPWETNESTSMRIDCGSFAPLKMKISAMDDSSTQHFSSGKSASGAVCGWNFDETLRVVQPVYSIGEIARASVIGVVYDDGTSVLVPGPIARSDVSEFGNKTSGALIQTLTKNRTVCVSTSGGAALEIVRPPQ